LASLGARCGDGFDSRVLRQPIHCFVTSQLRFHPIEGTLLCQTSANCLGGFAGVTGHVLEFVLELFFSGVDFFLGGDAIDHQLGLNVIAGTLFLALAEADPIDIDGAGIDTLLSEGADDTLEADVHLMLDE
jgi:hypothetical protein